MDLKYFTRENIEIVAATAETVYELKLVADEHNHHKEELKWFSRPSYHYRGEWDMIEHTIFFTSRSIDGCFYVIEE